MSTTTRKTTPAANRASGLNWPLMKNNISRDDLNAVCELLQHHDPVLTQSKQVRAFEEEWSQWLGVGYSVFVNSGSSANLVTLAALRELHGAGGEVIVPSITWVSDIASVLQCGFEPVKKLVRQSVIHTFEIDLQVAVEATAGWRPKQHVAAEEFPQHGIKPRLGILPVSQGLPGIVKVNVEV